MRACLLMILLMACPMAAFGQSESVFAADLSDKGIRDDFNSLDDWKSISFRGISRHTQYTIDSQEDGGRVLRAESRDSASGLIHIRAFNPFETPVLRWRWRVENVFAKGDVKQKQGDDYPMRVYVLFQYDPENKPLGMRMKYALVRRLYGQYPPHSTLNYIWANKKHRQRIFNSPYTDRSKMVILQSGDQYVGKWVNEEVNLLEDYRAAFAADPPGSAVLAIMSDSDNTGESAEAFLDFIEVQPE